MRYLLVCLLISGCADRDLCVAGAALDYDETINLCEAEKLNYDQCDRKYDIEKSFEVKQKACR